MSRRRRRPLDPVTRHTIPERLQEATRFSHEPAFVDELTLVSMVKGMAPLWRRLRRETRPAYKWGPDRTGEWALAYFAYVISRLTAVQPWHRRMRSHTAFWKACGFTQPPSYQLTALRFAELEEYADAFEAAGAHLVQIARSRDPRVGAWVHVDGTECETHASPQHDCRRGDLCPTRGTKRGRRIHRLPTEQATALRQANAEEAADAVEAGWVGGVRDGIEQIGVGTTHIDHRRGVIRFESGDHWWRSRDIEAGTRAYTAGGRKLRAWHGYYHHKAIDHFTGGVLAVDVHSAAEGEYLAYPRLYERLVANTGADPIAVAMDRGYSLERIYRFHSERGVTTVAPYRKRGPMDPPQAVGTDEWDEMGRPVCRHCGGETEQAGFFVDQGRPRIRFRCVLAPLDACDRTQSILCSRDWRRLLPIPRSSPVYMALRLTHENFEEAHQAWRSRYMSGGKSLAERPKRIGRGVHQLRACAALVIEWLWICHRHGWLGNRSVTIRTAQSVSDARLRGAITRTVRRARAGIAARLRPLPPLSGAPPGPLQPAPTP